MESLALQLNVVVEALQALYSGWSHAPTIPKEVKSWVLPISRKWRAICIWWTALINVIGAITQCICFYFLKFKLYFIVYTITIVLNFPPLPLWTQTPTHSGNPHTVVYVHGSCIYSLPTVFPMLWLTFPWLVCDNQFVFLFLLRFYLFILRETGMEGEKQRGKHQCVVASHTPATGDLDHNPVMCPDWESNCDPLAHRPALNPLSYTSQGQFVLLNPFTFFHSPLHPLPSDKYQNILCTYGSISVIFLCFFCF